MENLSSNNVVIGTLDGEAESNNSVVTDTSLYEGATLTLADNGSIGSSAIYDQETNTPLYEGATLTLADNGSMITGIGSSAIYDRETNTISGSGTILTLSHDSSFSRALTIQRSLEEQIRAEEEERVRRVSKILNTAEFAENPNYLQLYMALMETGATADTHTELRKIMEQRCNLDTLY